MASVKCEHVQMLDYVGHFIRTVEKCASNMEELLQEFVGSVDDSFNKNIEELLSHIQIQFIIISSIEKALETITEASMTVACNTELARCDTNLKYSAPHLHKHHRNRLRRSGFTLTDLFSP